MIHSLVAVASLALITSGSVAPAVVTPASSSNDVLSSDSVPLDAPAPTCIEHRSEVRFSSGYDHLVYVTNRCEKKAHCQVSTNVNPTPTEVTVAPGATETVLTFRGSPAREFTATVRCTLL